MSTPKENLGPQRTCIGCRQRAAQSELLRVTLGAGERGPTVIPDTQGRASGRGAYVHPRPVCVAQAERRRAFRRALRFEGGAQLDLSALHESVDPHT